MQTAIQVVSVASTIINSTKTIKASVEALGWLWKSAKYLRSRVRKKDVTIKELSLKSGWTIVTKV